MADWCGTLPMLHMSVQMKSEKSRSLEHVPFLVEPFATLHLFFLKLPLPVCFGYVVPKAVLTRKFSLFVNTSLTRSGDVP